MTALALLLALGVGVSTITALATPRSAATVPATLSAGVEAAVSLRTGAPLVKPSEQPGAVAMTTAEPQPSAPSAVRAAPLPPGTSVVRVGTASTYGPKFSERWVALPEGPGWAFRVCGPGGCRDLVSTDAGPDKAMQRKGRIVDLPVGAFAAVCGVPWTAGLCNVTLTIKGRVK